MATFRLTPRQTSLIRKKTKHHDLDPSEGSGELNIVPFLDIVTNIIMFLLATSAAVMATAQLDAQLPQLGRGGSGATAEQTLNLSVTVTPGGIVVAGSGGKLAPGCRDTASGRVITVPVGTRRLPNGSTEAYDWAALTACLAQVKTQFPEETQVILSADPDIQYEQIVHAMDAMRVSGETELFPNVMLSAGVR